jgi:glycosyltransferase involved in cell wall biosynthesis
VGITSYNDRAAVEATVREFKNCPQVTKVCVADNNSRDGSFQSAKAAGADSVVLETIPGYGSCCQAALAEASRGLGPDDVVVLCEGDMTFSAGDVRKFLAYLEHCDMVVGTRTTQELRESDTQMDWLINPGNQLMAKLTQVRFWEVRLTDVGCTYRALRVSAYHRLREVCHDRGMMFDYSMILAALRRRMRVIEVPIVFRQRVGESKGVGANKIKAVKATLALLRMLYAA